MKNLWFLLVFNIALVTVQAQEQKFPTVLVNGSAKISVVPDMLRISVGVSNNGNNPKDLKKKNDIIVDKIIKTIKSFKIEGKDFQTQQVYVYPNYDAKWKVKDYNASQTVVILIRDLMIYDQLTTELLQIGATNVQTLGYETSKKADLEKEARKLAVQNAQSKANDFVTALGQKLGLVWQILDQSYDHEGDVSQKRYMIRGNAVNTSNSDEEIATLAPGEITIKANVQVYFRIE